MGWGRRGEGIRDGGKFSKERTGSCGFYECFIKIIVNIFNRQYVKNKKKFNKKFDSHIRAEV